MTIWSRLSDIISSISARPAQAVIDRLTSWITEIGSDDDKRQLAFTVALIALSAKMAKADGVVTRDEIDAFKALFEVPEGQERNVARMFNLAKQDVAGFDAYAGQLAGLMADEPDILLDIVDGLFHIAKADGVIHASELEYLENVAVIFGLDDKAFQQIKIRHVFEGQDPYIVLGADRTWSDDALKRHYRNMVIEYHPDRVAARGVPPEFVRIANEKLADVNAAWDQIEKERGLS